MPPRSPKSSALLRHRSPARPSDSSFYFFSFLWKGKQIHVKNLYPWRKHLCFVCAVHECDLFSSLFVYDLHPCQSTCSGFQQWNHPKVCTRDTTHRLARGAGQLCADIRGSSARVENASDVVPRETAGVGPSSSSSFPLSRIAACSAAACSGKKAGNDSQPPSLMATQNFKSAQPMYS